MHYSQVRLLPTVFELLRRRFCLERVHEGLRLPASLRRRKQARVRGSCRHQSEAAVHP